MSRDKMQDLIWGWSGTVPVKVLVDAAGHLQVDVLSSALPSGGATAANQLTEITALQLIDDLRNALGSVNTDDLQVDIKDIAEGEIKCYGYDGTNWQTLLVESAALKNLRVKLYDGANDINSVLAAATMGGSDRGLSTRSGLYGWSTTMWQPIFNSDARYDNRTTVSQTLEVTAFLYGYNGASWDRLRTYPTGILKVARAEAELICHRMTGAGQLRASAGKLYWLSFTGNGGNAVVELSDDLDGTSYTQWSGRCLQNDMKHIVLDPPKPFSIGIYLKTATNTEVIAGHMA